MIDEYEILFINKLMKYAAEEITLEQFIYDD